MTDFKPENFPGNSINPEKKVERVARGKVRQRKAPLLDRIFGGETARGISGYIIWDVLVPAAKSTISDIVTNTIDMIFYGEEGRGRSRMRRDGSRTYVSYNSIYDGGRRESSRRPRGRNPNKVQDVIFERRVDADDVLITLHEVVDQYDVVTVADFYEAAGLPSEYTHSNYGWEDLRNAVVRPVRGGFIIDLPRPISLNY